MSATATAAAFWDAFDRLAGDVPITQIETESGLGRGTLSKARAAVTVPGSLSTLMAVAQRFGVAPAALLPDLAGAPQTPDAASICEIQLGCIRASALNPRRSFDDDAIAELAESIAAQGLLQNLVVRKDPDQPELYWVVAGERRSRALAKLRAEGRLPADLAANGIPCRIITLDDEEHVALALVENLQREDVNPMEEAEALDRLHRANPEKWTTKFLAERIGKTQRFVQQRLALAAKLPDDAKDALRGGRITIEQARVIASAPAEEMDDVIRRAVDHQIPAKHLALDVSHSFFPAKFALFDVATCGLETWTDPNTDEVFFPDFDTAMALQEAKVNEKQQAYLDAGADFVEIVEYFVPSHYPEGGKGVVICCDNDGEVSIFENRRRAEDVAAGKSEAAAPKVSHWEAAPKVSHWEAAPKVSHWEIEARYRAQCADAARKLVAKLGPTLSPTDAIALFLYGLALPAVSATKNYGANAEGPDQKALFNELRSFKLGDPAAFKHVRDCDLPLMDKAFSQAVAAMIHVGTTISPALLVLAQRHKIAVPAILRHTPKQKAEALKRIEQDLLGQTDLEDGVAAKKAAAATEEPEDEAA
jgi:ParB family chromosome partitioning protein